LRGFAVVGLLIAAVGVVAVVAGGALTKARIRSTFGTLNTGSVKASEGTGVVPSWISTLVLAGYAAVAIGLVVAVISAF
jgi:hypothetical protein